MLHMFYNACYSGLFFVTANASRGGGFLEAILLGSVCSDVISTPGPRGGSLCCVRPLHLSQTLHGGLFSILHLASKGFLKGALVRGQRRRF